VDHTGEATRDTTHSALYVNTVAQATPTNTVNVMNVEKADADADADAGVAIDATILYNII
jgi:hypothetical protein